MVNVASLLDSSTFTERSGLHAALRKSRVKRKRWLAIMNYSAQKGLQKEQNKPIRILALIHFIMPPPDCGRGGFSVSGNARLMQHGRRKSLLREPFHVCAAVPCGKNAMTVDSRIGI